MNHYVMVTTKESQRYTLPALRTFFRNTPFETADRFLLIDNDGSFDARLLDSSWPVTLHRNSAQLGFAANMNRGMKEALDGGADVFLLNNDLIFTRDWASALFEEQQQSIASPLSCRELQYNTGSMLCRTPMDLDDYLGHEEELEQIALYHREHNPGRLRVVAAPFFAVRIPHAVLSAVGLLDESFGSGGGEDYDYCLRAVLAGFEVVYCLPSYILHFGGKSSWSGAETAAEQLAREGHFMKVFRERWGDSLYRIVLREDRSLLESSPEVRRLIEANGYRQLVEQLRSGALAPRE